MTIHRSSILWLSILSRNFRVYFLRWTSLKTKFVIIAMVGDVTSLVCPFTVVPFGLGRLPAFESPLRAKSCIFWTTFRSIVFTKIFYKFMARACIDITATVPLCVRMNLINTWCYFFVIFSNKIHGLANLLISQLLNLNFILWERLQQ